ncbi:MAG: hypothetical protein LWX52_17390 [Deltaproteobacteria bacterium]|jgi:hypothetical protein|nr:hypothetical protein [Deltaproteobacteria bacterium]
MSGIAQRLIKYLADRRCLYLPFSLEVYGWVIESILEIRKRLSADLESVSMDSPLGQSIASMQAVCRKFLTDTQNLDSFHFPVFWGRLGELRAVFGIHITGIAYTYDLDVPQELEPILPSDTNADTEDDS